MTTIKENTSEAKSIGDISSAVVNALNESMAHDVVKRPATDAGANNYAILGSVLGAAYAQAASGKGKARHDKRNVAFDRQPIMEIGRMCGLGYPTGQAQKKTQEAVSMFNRGDTGSAEAELLGAINYLAAAVLLIRETKPAV